MKFFDFRESLAKQIREEGLSDKELALCLARFVKRSVDEVYSPDRKAIITHGDSKLQTISDNLDSIAQDVRDNIG